MELPPSPEVQYIVCISCCTSHCLRTQNRLQDLDLSQETAKIKLNRCSTEYTLLTALHLHFWKSYITFYGRPIIENKFN